MKVAQVLNMYIEEENAFPTIGEDFDPKYLQHRVDVEVAVFAPNAKTGEVRDTIRAAIQGVEFDTEDP